MSEADPSSAPLKKFPAFDGVRGISVAIVVFSHLPLVVGSNLYDDLWEIDQASRIGYIALDLFFAISGFLITRLLLRERAKTGRISFVNFYARRVIRIFPVYYIGILGCMIFLKLGVSDLLSLLTYTFNFYHPFNPAPHPLEHTWSLSVEEQFYFIWPLLIVLLPPRLLEMVTGRVLPCFAILCGFAISAILRGHDNRLVGDLVYMSLFTRMLSLSLGGWLAVREFENRPFRGAPCLLLFVMAILILLGDRFFRGAGFIVSQGNYWTIALMAYSMISVSIVSTLVFDNGKAQRALTAFLCFPLFRGLGQISYALYVFHLPVLFYLNLNDGYLNGGRSTLARVGLACAISIGLAVASYFLVERPLSKLKANFSSTRETDTMTGPGLASVRAAPGVAVSGDAA